MKNSASANYVIRTKMSAALLEAAKSCPKAGKVGRHIVTAAARGVGVKFVKKAPELKAA